MISPFKHSKLCIKVRICKSVKMAHEQCLLFVSQCSLNVDAKVFRHTFFTNLLKDEFQTCTQGIKAAL